MNQVIVERTDFGYSVGWKTPFGEFNYSSREIAKEAWQLAHWISRYYLRFEYEEEHLEVPVRKKFTELPEIIFI